MQLSNYLATITCFFLFLFSIHLFFSKTGYKRQNILLSIIFFTRFGQISTSLLINSEHKEILPILFQSFTPFYFAAPICLYLYVTGFLYDLKKLKNTDYLHFIPVLLAIIHVIPWPAKEMLDWQQISAQISKRGYLFLKVNNGLLPVYFQTIFRPILIISYLCLSWFAFYKAKNNKSVNIKAKKWILLLLRIVTFFQILGFSPILFKNFNLPLYNLFIVLNCLALLIVFVYALHKPNIFYGHLLTAIDWNKKIIKLEVADVGIKGLDVSPIKVEEPTIKKIHNSKKINLSPEQISTYTTLMKNVMEEECFYLNKDLQIIDLATKINIPIHHCSFILNNHIGENFRDWINGYRIDYFLKLYPNLKDKITIEAIAQESGFKSHATFYNAFRKKNGSMPKVYFSPDSAE